jgi:hypothetical protein
VVIGLGLVTISSTLSVFMFIHAGITGGYPFYHPVELFCIRLGTLTAIIGLVAALAGKGKPRFSVVLISAINLLIWFGDAMAQ